MVVKRKIIIMVIEIIHWSVVLMVKKYVDRGNFSGLDIEKYDFKNLMLTGFQKLIR